MAVHILGQTSVIELGPLRIWPERGLVCVEDGRDNTFEQLSVRDALLRVKAINDSLQRAKMLNMKEPDRKRNQAFVEAMITVIKRAREQGSPDDPSAVRDLTRRLPTSVSVPANFVTME